MLVRGSVLRGGEGREHFRNLRTMTLETLAIWPARAWGEQVVECFEADDILLSSCFVPVHMPTASLLIDQSYSNVEKSLPTRFRVEGATFELETEPHLLPGRYLLLGGPIDTVWYHWLFNWAPRLLLVRRMRPDILGDPAISIAVHPLALEEPYRAILRCFGLPMARYVAMDPAKDQRLEQAVLVSFLDQDKLFPAIIDEMRELVLRAFKVRLRPSARRRLFASRQSLQAPKRRIANFDDVQPVLERYGFRIVDLGRCAAIEQASLFFNSDIILGGHGSDLTNILFCRPGTKVIVIEHDFNIDHRLHAGLEYLCEVLRLDYRLLRAPTARTAGPGGETAHGRINEDYLIDPAMLSKTLDAVLEQGGGGVAIST